MKSLPSISIVTGTLNPRLSLFESVLKSIHNQTYPGDLIEHIVMDAGSTNGSIELAKKYGCSVEVREDLVDQEEIRASLGIKKARGDLVLILESDNIPRSKNWLKEMVQPFLDNKKVFCTFSAYNSFNKKSSMTTRYGAFFGAADPFLYYLGKSEKIPLLQKNYNKGKKIDEKPGYYIIEFNKENLPTIGDNGTLFLRKAMDKVNKDPELYVHPDAFLEMLDLGYNTYGVVKNSIIHVIPSNVLNYAKRRVKVKDTFYDKRRGGRKYLVFNWQSNKDILNLLRFIFFSITFIFPLYESIKGYIKTKDKAWFLHPLLCFLMLVSYGGSEIGWFLRRKYL